VGFSKSKLMERMERLRSFINDQEGLSCQPIDSLEKGKHRAIAWSMTELALVTFTHTGSMELTVPAGKVKETILAWVAQEICPCHDHSGPAELAKLDPYRYLLASPDEEGHSVTFPPPGGLQMTPSDNPLVELAELVGYSVHLLPVTEASSHRYAIVTEQEITLQGSDLPVMIAQLLTGRVIGEANGSLPLPRKVYLPRSATFPLAYLRRQTRWDGASMTQQMLADLAGISLKTVQGIEQEQRTRVYPGTARSIIWALNEARDREGLPLIQLWNVDWTHQESDGEPF